MFVDKIILFLMVLVLASCQKATMIKPVTHEIMPKFDEPIAQQAAASIKKKNVTVIEDGIYVDVLGASKLESSFLDDKLSFTSKGLTKDDLFIQLISIFGDSLSIDPDVLRNPRGKKVGYISSFDGTKKEFLNYLCHVYSCSWNVNKNKVFVTHMITKSWHLDLSLDEKNVNASMDSSGKSGQDAQGGGQSVRAKQSYTSKSKFNAFESVKKLAESVIGKDGTVEVSLSLGLITATSTHDKINRLDQIIVGINKKANQLISVEVEILTLKRNKLDERGTNFNMLFNNGNLGANFNLMNLGSTDSGNFQFNIVDPQDEFTGSTALIQSISRNAEIVSKRTELMTTLNGEPVVIKAGTIEPFFELTTTPVANSDQVLQTITTKEVPIGFSLSLVPMIIGDGGEIRLNMQLSDSKLVRKERVTFGGGSFVEYPVSESSDFARTVKVRSGQYMMVSGRSNGSESKADTGAIHHSVALLGGNKNISNENEYVVVLVNASVVN
jgi:type IVB pilus formation R64 PilN family outer membrane protein